MMSKLALEELWSQQRINYGLRLSRQTTSHRRLPESLTHFHEKAEDPGIVQMVLLIAYFCLLIT